MLDALALRPLRLLPAFLGCAVGALAWSRGVDPDTAVPVFQLVLIVFAVTVTELLPIEPPRSRPVPTSTAVIATAALMGVEAPVLAVLTALGWTFAGLIDRRRAAVATLVVAVTTSWLLGGLAAWGRTFEHTWRGDLDSQVGLDLVAAGLVVTILIAVLPTLQASVLSDAARFPLRRVVDEIRAAWSADLAIASTAVMGALVHRPLGFWTLPSMLVPLLAARIGLQRFAGVSTAYDQTIRAMSRLPEQLGTVGPDHGIRVGQLARRVAVELKLDATSVLDVERAAYLHELGHISLEPEDRPTRAELARAGARVIESAGDLDRVAAIVAAHGDPNAMRDAPRDLALGARIVAACCEADGYAPDLADPGQRHEVTVRLVRDVDDLDVVQALLAVLDRTVRPPARL